MNWTEQFIEAINYIEDNILEDITAADVSLKVGISSFYFQKGFSIYAGCSVSEYIKSRRLYLAALDVRSSNLQIIDIAYKYRYETPESFTKAFKRFHSYTPLEIRKGEGHIRMFLPLKIIINIKGLGEMDYIIEKEEQMNFIGIKINIKEGEGYEKCPKFWDSFYSKYISNINDGSKVSEAIKKYSIGQFAICVGKDNKSFDYYICGRCPKDTSVEGLDTFTLPQSMWAKFKCVGPLPGALQAVNSKIYQEWLPNNKEYELTSNIDIEYYSDGDPQSPSYTSEIWLPIKEK